MAAPQFLNASAQFVIVISPVADDGESPGELRLLHERHHMVTFVGLSANQQQCHSTPAEVCHQHELGVSPAFGFPHGLLFRATRGIGSRLVQPDVGAIHEAGFAGWRSHAFAGLCPEAEAVKDHVPAVNDAPRPERESHRKT